jgi:hypothetical protein
MVQNIQRNAIKTGEVNEQTVTILKTQFFG